MSNDGIWVVTGVEAEARYLANYAAYRAKLDTGAWIARAVCTTLGLPESAAEFLPDAPVADETIAEMPAAAKSTQQPKTDPTRPDPDEAVMVAALKEMGERLDEPLKRSTEKTPTPGLDAEWRVPSQDDRIAPPASRPQRKSLGERIGGVVSIFRSVFKVAAVLRRGLYRAALATAALLVFASPFIIMDRDDRGALWDRAGRAATSMKQSVQQVAGKVTRQADIKTASAPNSKRAFAKASAGGPDAPAAVPAKGAESPLVAKLKLAAASGDARAQFQLGMRYAIGAAVPRDGRRATLWLHRAASQSLPDAQFNLAVIYANGLGVLKDPKKALFLYKRAADRRHAGALNNLAIAHTLGSGTPVNPGTGAALLAAAARRGLPIAMYNLGIFHEFGVAGPPDPITALEWYRRGAEAGHSLATRQHRALSAIVGTGGEVPNVRRPTEAARLLHQAPLDRAAASLKSVRSAETGTAKPTPVAQP